MKRKLGFVEEFLGAGHLKQSPIRSFDTSMMAHVPFGHPDVKDSLLDRQIRTRARADRIIASKKRDVAPNRRIETWNGVRT